MACQLRELNFLSYLKENADRLDEHRDEGFLFLLFFAALDFSFVAKQWRAFSVSNIGNRNIYIFNGLK